MKRIGYKRRQTRQVGRIDAVRRGRADRKRMQAVLSDKAFIAEERANASIMTRLPPSCSSSHFKRRESAAFTHAGDQSRVSSSYRH